MPCSYYKIPYNLDNVENLRKGKQMRKEKLKENSLTFLCEKRFQVQTACQYKGKL